MATGLDALKQEAAELAVRLVEPGMVVGLGSGSTASFAVKRIAELLESGALTDIVGIASSRATEAEARKLGIPLATLESHPEIDLTIDGADEVDPKMNLIKGGGGALLKEKILAQASRRTVIIVDESKVTPQIGTRWPVPVEVFPLARRTEENYLKSLGATVTLRLRDDKTPFVTDLGNIILDARFGPIRNPGHLSRKLCHRAGIVEHGLFIGVATDVIVVCENGTRHLKKRQRRH